MLGRSNKSLANALGKLYPGIRLEEYDDEYRNMVENRILEYGREQK